MNALLRATRNCTHPAGASCQSRQPSAGKLSSTGQRRERRGTGRWAGCREKGEGILMRNTPIPTIPTAPSVAAQGLLQRHARNHKPSKQNEKNHSRITAVRSAAYDGRGHGILVLCCAVLCRVSGSIMCGMGSGWCHHVQCMTGEPTPWWSPNNPLLCVQRPPANLLPIVGRWHPWPRHWQGRPNPACHSEAAKRAG